MKVYKKDYTSKLKQKKEYRMKVSTEKPYLGLEAIHLHICDIKLQYFCSASQY